MFLLIMMFIVYKCDFLLLFLGKYIWVYVKYVIMIWNIIKYKLYM